MKPIRIGIILFIFIFSIVGISIFARILIKQEEKSKIKDTTNKGQYLVSLIALYSLPDLVGDKCNFFLRTLAEYTSYEGLAYCYIHDQTGKPLISLAPDDLVSKIPGNILSQSLFAMGLLKQSFRLSGSDQTIYEFARPFFESGRKTGTVRIGLILPDVTIFSLERISLLAMIAFLMISAVIFAYYVILLDLKPLEKLKQSITKAALDSTADVDSSKKVQGIAPLVADFRKSIAAFEEKLDKIETENVALVSKLGVTTFERNQIINMLDSINFGIIITDLQDNISHINDYMLKLLKKTREDVIDRSVDETFPNDEIIAFISQQDVLDRAGTVGQIETTFPDLAPGEIFQTSLSYLNDGEGSPIGKMMLVKNITGEKSAKKNQLELIAHISHELITPLTSIRSYSEMLMDGEINDSETQNEFYNTINEETVRLTKLIKDLLNISKIDMGSLTLNKGPVRSDWLFDDSMQAIEATALAKSITVEKNLPDNFPFLVADKELLKVAIINILGNAVKYTPENGRITFSIIEQDNMVVFEIMDNGCGVSKEDLPHIFERFYRSSNPDIVQQTGSGLGLAITAEIVHLHDGEIDAQSEPGKGTHFTVKIPKEEYHIGKI